eukprot:SAG31_NODE_1984_length_6740_cov_4.949255_10_plen_61_part_00
MSMHIQMPVVAPAMQMISSKVPCDKAHCLSHGVGLDDQQHTLGPELYIVTPTKSGNSGAA